MPICHSCRADVDATALAAGRCARCGAVLRTIPQRTVHDVSQTTPPAKPSPAQGDDFDEYETVDPVSNADTKDNLERDTVQSPPSKAAGNGDPAPAPPGQRTIDLAGEQTIEISGQAETTPPTSSPPGPPTINLAGDATIELSGDASGEQPERATAEPSEDDTDSLVTAQWLENVAGSKSDTGATIKQKETVSGPMLTRSSVVVKSRRVRSGKEVGTPITSAADAPDYELLEIIGEGGMGVVYSAKQSAIARTVAVKMLKGADEKTAEQRDKFVSEAVVTGELDHPNIVPIYDLGANDAGALFYSMKRVRGTPWDSAVKHRSLDENLNILLRVADAVAFAHANGVIHRDLKPENIMLGDYGEVLVMDWGLARISDEFPNADAVSQSDVMGGTPAYMAPEMATGPIGLVTIASDIYLLGAILYEVIAGRAPHTGKTVMACLFAAAKNKIVEVEQSGELMDIAMRAMATKPEDRYATVQEFQDAIRQYQSHSESVLLTDSAANKLGDALESDDYDLYSRALYGFEEALQLWDGNVRAGQLIASARAAYAESALDRADFDLGISLLESNREQHADLLTRLQAGRDERESRQRRLKMLKGLVAVLVAAVVAIVSFAYVAVSTERDKAVVQRDRAVKAEGEALQNFEEAEAARKVADTQRQRAETEKERAETEKERAESEQARAEREEARAKEQEQIAIQAKQDEEYEAYVARIGLASAKIEENAFDRAWQLLERCNPELSHWEWGRLAHLCQLSHRTWQADGPVQAVAFSPDGRRFASADWDGKARIWDVETGEALQSIAQGQYVHAVALDATGQRLAVGSSNSQVSIHDVKTGQQLQSLEGHTDAVLSVRFSPDGERLLTAGYDNTARIWNLATGELQQTLDAHNWWVWAAEFSPDGRRIVTASQDGKAIVWHRAAETDATYTPLTEFTKHRGPIYAAEFSPDGKTIATAGYDRRILLWNPDEVEPIDIAGRLDELPDPPAPYRELAGHDGPVRSVAFAPDGQSLVSGGQDNVIRRWQVESGKQTAVLRGHASHVRDCRFSPDGNWLLSAGRDGQIKLWQPESYGEMLVLGRDDQSTASDAVLAARFSRDGGRIVTASRDRTAALWDVDGQKLIRRFAEGHDFLASSAVFFDDGTRLATGAGDGTVRIWDVATGTEILQLDRTGSTAALDVSADGRWIVTGSAGNEAAVWDAQSGQLVARLAGHDAAIGAVGFAPDGQTIATGDERGRCRLWQLGNDGTWSGSQWLSEHSRAITSLAFADDGQRLITSSGDNTCAQWDVATGEEIAELVLTHPTWVADMDVSDDGAMAITTCDDGSLRLWSLADAQLVRTIDPRGDVVFTSVDLSPDGQAAVAACAANGTVQIWDLESGAELTGDDTQQAWLSFGGRGGIVWTARFAPDGQQVLTMGGNDARLWNVATREPVVRFSPHGAVAAADISPDGRLLVTGSWDRSAKIWDIETGQAIRKLEGVHEGYLNSVEFSPDGTKILTASDDGTARLWDVASGAPLEPVLRGHESRVRQASFTGDGQRVLTTSNDKTARIWDAQTGESLMVLEGHEWAVLCGEFSRDGRHVITGSEDNTAIVWVASTGEPLLKLAGHTDSITSVAFSPDGARALTGSQDNVAKLWDASTGKEILTLAGHAEELTSVAFSPDGQTALTSGRDGATILWPAIDWHGPRERQAAQVGR